MNNVFMINKGHDNLWSLNISYPESYIVFKTLYISTFWC
nr:MAG TPA: hypothetical protein [Caudoviricetes sp.]